MKDEAAELWDRRNSETGEPYKRFVTYPVVRGLIGSTEGKTVLDLGCGNGRFGAILLDTYGLDMKKLILVDKHPANLEYARKNLGLQKCLCEFVQADFEGMAESLDSDIADIVISANTFCEIEDIDNALKETYRITKPGGIFVMATVHPAYSLKKYLEAKLTGGSAKKIVPARHYFDNAPAEFVMGAGSDKEVRAPHYTRTVQVYVNSLINAGFSIEALLEPGLNSSLLEAAPRFESEADCPVVLVIKAAKNI